METLHFALSDRPDMKFREQIKDELIPDEPKKSILKRDSSSFEEGKDVSCVW